MHGPFTSESVCAGHPDKIADQISDAVVDAVLAQDPYGHVACETAVTKDFALLFGEITSTASIDPEAIARAQIKRLGYTEDRFHFTDRSPIQVRIQEQSPEIAVGVNNDGAGDQGMMYGYASDETKNYMPAAIAIAHRLAARVDQVREDGTLPYLRPDGKTQVTLVYEHGKAVAAQTVVVSVPHNEEIELGQVREDIYHHIVTEIMAEFGFSLPFSDLAVNSTGVWHNGGPAIDGGLTGRKIIADSYGSYARAGGGAFSGKDPTKVDRSGAYYARYIAKNIVAQDIAKVAEVRIAYKIGLPYPEYVEVEDFGTMPTAKISALQELLRKIGTKSVREIIEDLHLRTTRYLPTAAYGHFGRKEFPWEKIEEL
ncbi:MAG: methionine adenosyltransferase [Candidatus Woesebacteria bacterium]